MCREENRRRSIKMGEVRLRVVHCKGKTEGFISPLNIPSSQPLIRFKWRPSLLVYPHGVRNPWRASLTVASHMCLCEIEMITRQNIRTAWKPTTQYRGGYGPARMGVAGSLDRGGLRGNSGR